MAAGSVCVVLLCYNLDLHTKSQECVYRTRTFMRTFKIRATWSSESTEPRGESCSPCVVLVAWTSGPAEAPLDAARPRSVPEHRAESYRPAPPSWALRPGARPLPPPPPASPLHGFEIPSPAQQPGKETVLSRTRRGAVTGIGRSRMESMRELPSTLRPNCLAFGSQHPAAPLERKGYSKKGFRDFPPKAKARIWL